jgi:tripeptidyl-peptidase I
MILQTKILVKMIQMLILCILVSMSIMVSASILKGRSLNITRNDYKLIGRAAAETRHQLIISIKQNNIDLVKDILYDVSTISSPNYGKHKSFDEIGKLVENPKATEAVALWLQQNNVVITQQTPYGEYITGNAPISTWEKLFETEFYEYQRIDDNDAPTISVLRAKYYYIPDHLADSIEHVINLLNLPPRTTTSRPEKLDLNKLEPGIINSEDANPAVGAYPSAYVVPSTLYKMYSIYGNGSYSTSQSVYESIGQSYLASDLTLFQTSNNIPVDAVDATIGSVPSGSTCTTNANNCAEASLDLQYMLAVSPYSPMTYYYDSTGDGSFLPWITSVAALSNPSHVYSISYSSYETDNDLSDLQSFNNEAIKLGARGVTIVASSGDDGITGFKFYSTSGTPISQCGYYAQWPASSPYVVAVGGTMYGKYITNSPEIVCSSATGASITSGGGFSNAIAAPAFQRAAINSYIAQYTAGQSSYQPYNTSNRGYPDVSMAASRYSK